MLAIRIHPRFSIRWKLTATIVGVALALAFLQQLLFGLYDASTYPKIIEARVQILARVLGNNSTSALMFRDRKDALEVLGSLRAETTIESAYLFCRCFHDDGFAHGHLSVACNCAFAVFFHGDYRRTPEFLSGYPPISSAV